LINAEEEFVSRSTVPVYPLLTYPAELPTECLEEGSMTKKEWWQI
jgi:hypothetical protein